MAGRVLSIRTQVDDQGTKAIRDTTQATKELAEAAKATGQTIAANSDKVTKAKQGELSATKQVEQAMRLEMASGNLLATHLARLRNEYETLEVKMRAAIRAGGAHDAAMVKQAGDAKRGIDAIEQLIAARERQAAAARREADSTRAAHQEVEKHSEAAVRSDRVLTQLANRFLGVSAAVQATRVALRELFEQSAEMQLVAKATTEIADATAKATTETELFKNTMLTYAVVLKELGEQASDEDSFLATQAKIVGQIVELTPVIGQAITAYKALTGAVAESEAGLEAEAEALRDRLAAIEEANPVTLVPLVSEVELEALEQAKRKTKELLELRKKAREEERQFMEGVMNIGSDADIKQGKAGRLAENERYRRDHIDSVNRGFAAGTRDYIAGLSGGLNNADVEMHKSIETAMKERAKTAEEAAQREADAYMQAGQQIGSALGQAFGAMITDSENAEKHAKAAIASILQMGIKAAVEMIAMETAKGSAAAVSAHAGIPFVGPAVGAAAAAAVSALIGSLATFARGGIVTGGIPGRDSVPIMAMPGEMVLPVDVTRALLRAAGSGGKLGGRGLGFAGGGVVPSSAPAGQFAGMTLVVQANNRREGEQSLEAIAKGLTDLSRRGKWNLPRVV